MQNTLTEMCEYLNNYWPRIKAVGHYAIVNGQIIVPEVNGNSWLKENQYFRIIGSIFNDGVHKYPATDLVDEEFDGCLWAMAVPSAVIALASDIEAWQTKYGGIDSPNMSPMQSESFQNYSYTKKASGSDANSDEPITWQSTFSSRLNKWRRLRGLHQ